LVTETEHNIKYTADMRLQTESVHFTGFGICCQLPDVQPIVRHFIVDMLNDNVLFQLSTN